MTKNISNSIQSSKIIFNTSEDPKNFIIPNGGIPSVLSPVSAYGSVDEFIADSDANMLTKHRDKFFNQKLKKMRSNSDGTKTQDTRKQGSNSDQDLLNRYLTKIGSSHKSLTSDQQIQFFYWVAELMSKVPYDTCIKYREYAIAVNSSHFQLDDEIATSILCSPEVEKDLEEKRARDLANGKIIKARYITYHDYLAILHYLQHQADSPYAEVALHLFIASIATGLRSYEWIATELREYTDSSASNKTQLWLSVVSAKSTNGWANKVCRHQILTNIWPAERVSIFNSVAMGQHWFKYGNYKKFQRGIAKLFKEINQVIKFSEGLYIDMSVPRH